MFQGLIQFNFCLSVCCWLLLLICTDEGTINSPNEPQKIDEKYSISSNHYISLKEAKEYESGDHASLVSCNDEHYDLTQYVIKGLSWHYFRYLIVFYFWLCTGFRLDLLQITSNQVLKLVMLLAMPQEPSGAFQTIPFAVVIIWLQELR